MMETEAINDIAQKCAEGANSIIDSIKNQNCELLDVFKQQNVKLFDVIAGASNEMVKRWSEKYLILKEQHQTLQAEYNNLNNKYQNLLSKCDGLSEQIAEFEKWDTNFKLANGERKHTSIPIDMKEAAHIISCNAYKLIIGRNKLMKYLRVLKYLDKDNKPYQKYINDKYFKVEITRCGSFMNSKTCFTQKGIQLLQNKILQAISDAEQLGYDFTKGGE